MAERLNTMSNAYDSRCGLCGEPSRWQVQYRGGADDYRHSGACSEHLAWACRLLQSASHIATVLTVWPTLHVLKHDDASNHQEVAHVRHA